MSELDTSAIPKGHYCYTIEKIEYNENGMPIIRTKCCPYWEGREDKPEHAYGYCHFLKAGDWEENGTMFLWDQVKECGINLEDDKYTE